MCELSGFGLKRAKASPIALDFGASALKAMQVVPGNPVRLVDASIIETPAELIEDPMGRLAFQFEHLPELLKGRSFIGRRASCSVSAAQTLVQHVQTPADTGDSAAASIEAIAESLGCAASQLVARSLDVTTIVFANRTYQILKGEFAGVDAGEPGRKALDMLNLDNPSLNWVSLANGMGVTAISVRTAEDFSRALADSMREKGPRLIEVVM